MDFLIEDLHRKHGGIRWGYGGPTPKELLENPKLLQSELDKEGDLLYEAIKIGETARRRRK